jgi:hypothetical protein
LPGQSDGKHLVNIDKPWQAVRKAARIEDVRLDVLHDKYDGGSFRILIGRKRKMAVWGDSGIAAPMKSLHSGCRCC